MFKPSVRSLAVVAAALVSALASCGEAPNEETAGASGAPAPGDASVRTVANVDQSSNEAAMREFMEEVFNKGNLAVADKYVAAEYIEHTPSPGQEPTLDGFKQFVTGMRNAFPDTKVTVNHVFTQGDLVAVHITQTGTHKGSMMGEKPTGKPFNLSGIDLVRMKDGKIVEHWGYYEEIKMLQHLGLMPPMDSSAAPGAGAKAN